MPSTINTGVTLRGLNGTFFPKFEAANVLWRLLCSLVQSDGASETYKWLGQLPMPNEWKGSRRSKALGDFGQTLVNQHWESMLEIDRDEYADDQTGQLAVRTAEMATRFAQHPDKILVDLIEAAESTACYDGQYFFDTDHVEGDSGSQSNDLTYDVATPADPTASEFEKAFWQAVEALVGFVDDQGEPWNLFTDFEQMEGLLVMVPKNMLRVASQVLGVNAAPIIDSTSNILAGRAKVVTTPRLSWTTKFSVFKVDDAMRPLIFQQRQQVQTQIKDDPEEKPVKYMADARYAVGYGLWQKATLTTLT